MYTFKGILQLIASGTRRDLDEARKGIWISKIRKYIPKDQLKVLNAAYEMSSGLEGMKI